MLILFTRWTSLGLTIITQGHRDNSDLLYPLLPVPNYTASDAGYRMRKPSIKFLDSGDQTTVSPASTPLRHLHTCRVARRVAQKCEATLVDCAHFKKPPIDLYDF